MDMYEIDELLRIFSKHAQLSEKQRLQNIKSFQENYPGEELPVYMKDDFNLPKAMATLCFEILQLKNAFVDRSTMCLRSPNIPSNGTTCW